MNSYSQYIVSTSQDHEIISRICMHKKRPYFYRGNSSVFPFIHTSTKAIDEMITSMIGTRTINSICSLSLSLLVDHLLAIEYVHGSFLDLPRVHAATQIKGMTELS